MKKIKLLFYTELWANAGIESVIMSLFRNFDLNRIQVDIMASQNVSDFYDEEIQKLGGRKIITLEKKYTSPAKRMFDNQEKFRKIVEKNKYDVVHIHMCNAAAMVYGKIAKELKVPVVAFHSHNTNLSTSHRWIKTLAHDVAKFRYERYGDILFSCSDLASEWMYSQKAINSGKVILIKNAIDLEKFRFSEKQRKDLRKELELDGKVVIGHIGRFAVAKNHTFLIDVFNEYHKKNKNARLLLIGEGEDEEKIKNKVKSEHLENVVIFYGVTKSIPQMLWAMDVFVLPSLFEGNPVVGIEAQAAGTPCIFADTITKMCNISGNVKYLSLKDPFNKWAEQIDIASKENRNSMATEKMRENGYDIKKVAEEVQRIYEAVLSK